MATYTEIRKPETVATENPVATAPVVPVQTVAPTTSIQPTISSTPILSPVSPTAVYDPINVSQIDVPSTKRATDMKLADMEKKLAKAQSVAELNQINIMNQPKAMGVLTGEAAHQSRLDTAKINAFTSLWNARIAEEQRKEEEKQAFISQYGADPSQRPKGMSKKEFSAALGQGQFSNLLTPEAQMQRLELAAKKKSLAGTPKSDKIADAKTSLTAQIYAGTITREAAKAIFSQQYPDQDPNWVYSAAPDSYEQNIKGGAGLNTQQQTVIGQVSGQFDNEPVVKEYNTLQQQKSFINNLNNNTNNPADDQAIIYSFAKVMDPTSVVRESEYNTVQEYSQALLQRYGFKAKRVFDNSGFLSPEARGFLKETLNNRIKANEESYQNIYNEYGRRIEERTGLGNGTTYLTNYSGGYSAPVQAKPQQMNYNGQIYVLGEDGNYYPQ